MAIIRVIGHGLLENILFLSAAWQGAPAAAVLASIYHIGVRTSILNQKSQARGRRAFFLFILGASQVYDVAAEGD